jgi:guanylate kinase
MPRKGILFLLVGPSGAGKNTLMKRVQQQINDLPQLPTATTRGIRPGEQEGREHEFVTPEEFQRRIDVGAFVEYQAVHMGNRYGTPRKTVEEALDAGRDLIADVEPLGALKVHAAYPENTVLIFVTPSNLDTLEERIRQRGDVKPDVLANRLARVRFEMAFAGRCHYVLLNDWLEPASEHLRQIVLSERARRRGTTTLVPHILTPPQIHSTGIVVVQHGDHVLARLHGEHPAFPTFEIADITRPPHGVVQEHVARTLSLDASLDEIRDKRFDFPAPHYAVVATIPHDAYLYYYYKFSMPLKTPINEWDWHTISGLKLPIAIKRLVQAQPEIA